MNSDDARARLTAERDRLTQVYTAASRLQGDDTSESSGDGLPSEKASETIERELDESVAAKAREDLDAIDEALKRLDDGTYGKCEVCGEPIEDGRLEALPAARRCVGDAAKAS